MKKLLGITALTIFVGMFLGCGEQENMEGFLDESLIGINVIALGNKDNNESVELPDVADDPVQEDHPTATCGIKYPCLEEAPVGEGGEGFGLPAMKHSSHIGGGGATPSVSMKSGSSIGGGGTKHMDMAGVFGESYTVAIVGKEGATVPYANLVISYGVNEYFIQANAKGEFNIEFASDEISDGEIALVDVVTGDALVKIGF